VQLHDVEQAETTAERIHPVSTATTQDTRNKHPPLLQLRIKALDWERWSLPAVKCKASSALFALCCCCSKATPAWNIRKTELTAPVAEPRSCEPCTVCVPICTMQKEKGHVKVQRTHQDRIEPACLRNARRNARRKNIYTVSSAMKCSVRSWLHTEQLWIVANKAAVLARSYTSRSTAITILLRFD
jgi:hypothetical protein